MTIKYNIMTTINNHLKKRKKKTKKRIFDPSEMVCPRCRNEYMSKGRSRCDTCQDEIEKRVELLTKDVCDYFIIPYNNKIVGFSLFS